MIEKSLRQYYQEGKKVSPFKKGLETIAGKGADVIGKVADVTGKFAPETTGKKTSTFGSTVKSQAKSAIQNKIQSAVLSKLGLSFLNPFMGIASLFGFDPFSMAMSQAKKHGIMQGFAPDSTSFLNPFGTQEAWEANQEAQRTQNRIDNLLSRKAAGKGFSQKNLNELTMGSKPGFYGNVPTVSRINLAKHLIDMPEHLGDRGSITKTPTSLVNPIHEARLRDQAIKDKAIKDAKIQEEVNEKIAKSLKDVVPKTPTIPNIHEGEETISTPTVTGPTASPSQMSKDARRQSALERGRGGVGRGGGGAPTGVGNPMGYRAQGGLIGKPLPGRNRYL